MNQKIKKELLELSDKKYKKFHEGLCPGTKNIIGVRVPILRKYAKNLCKEKDWKKTIEEIDNEYYEEIMLQGMLIGQAKNEDINTILKYVENYVPKIYNWAICDVFCAGLKITIEEEYLEEDFKVFEKIKHDDYYVKMAIAWAISICLIKYFDKTIKFISSADLDVWTYNKAIQKAIESYRISDYQKDFLRKMKK